VENSIKTLVIAFLICVIHRFTSDIKSVTQSG